MEAGTPTLLARVFLIRVGEAETSAGLCHGAKLIPCRHIEARAVGTNWKWIQQWTLAVRRIRRRREIPGLAEIVRDDGIRASAEPGLIGSEVHHIKRIEEDAVSNADHGLAVQLVGGAKSGQPHQFVVEEVARLAPNARIQRPANDLEVCR